MKWVSVKKGLPEVKGVQEAFSENVLVWGWNKYEYPQEWKVKILAYHFRHGFGQYEVTHWMPLPKPPKK